MNNPKEYIKIILIILIFILPYFFVRKKVEKLNQIPNITGYDDSTVILFTQLNCRNCDEAQAYIEKNFSDEI